jgi:AraC family transcriptional regulator
MSVVSRNFAIRETHGVLQRPGVQILLSSDNRGWSSLYASVRQESPFEGAFDAVADHAMVLHLTGQVMASCRTPRGEVSRLYQAGSIVIFPGGMDVRVRLGGTARSLHLYLRLALIEELAADIIDCDPTHVEILPRFGERDPLIEGLMHGVIDALRDEDQTVRPCVDYLARAIAACLVRKHSNARTGRNSAALAAHVGRQALQRAIDYIHAHLSADLSLIDIAGAAFLSPYHFSRVFKNSVGLSPHQYVLRARVEAAKDLLIAGQNSLGEIASRVGFSDQSHLTRHFKRRYGVPPGAFAKQSVE